MFVDSIKQLGMDTRDVCNWADERLDLAADEDRPLEDWESLAEEAANSAGVAWFRLTHNSGDNSALVTDLNALLDLAQGALESQNAYCSEEKAALLEKYAG